MPTKIDPVTGKEIDLATGRPIVNAPARPDAPVPVPVSNVATAQAAQQRSLVPGQPGYDIRLDPKAPPILRRVRVRNISNEPISEELDGRKFTMDPGQIAWVDSKRRAALGTKVANVSIGETQETNQPEPLHIVRIVAVKPLSENGVDYPAGECFEIDNIRANELIAAGSAVPQAT